MALGKSDHRTGHSTLKTGCCLDVYPCDLSLRDRVQKTFLDQRALAPDPLGLYRPWVESSLSRGLQADQLYSVGELGRILVWQGSKKAFARGVGPLSFRGSCRIVVSAMPTFAN